MSTRKSSAAGGPVKPVFLTPSNVEFDSFYIAEGLNSNSASTSTGSEAEIGKLIEKYSLPEDVEKQLQEHNQEEHKKRMNSLRGELEYLDKTDWMFQNHNLKK